MFKPTQDPQRAEPQERHIKALMREHAPVYTALKNYFEMEVQRLQEQLGNSIQMELEKMRCIQADVRRLKRLLRLIEPPHGNQ